MSAGASAENNPMNRGKLLWLLAAQAVGAFWAGGATPSFRVVSSFYPVYVATINVVRGVPGVEVINMAASAAGCLHDYRLTPEDMVALSRANAWVVNGAGLEPFIEAAKRQVPSLTVIQASEGIPLIRERGGDNPHVWVSVSRHILQVRHIAEGLARADPSHAEAYRKNARDYTERLEQLRRRMAETLKPVRQRDLVTFHEAFAYFADEFGFRVVAVIEREPGAEPSAREMAEIVRRVRETGVKTIFVEPQYPAKAAEAVARESGAAVGVLDPAVSGPDRPDAYIDIMERNLKTLASVLK
jgi:zinc transport system substrate-binding protein